MKASEIPVGHLCYNEYLNKCGVITQDYDSFGQWVTKRYVTWFHNFCTTPVEKCSDEYKDLGPIKFNVVVEQEVVYKTEISFDV